MKKDVCSLLPACQKTGSFSSRPCRGLHLFLTPKLHGLRGFPFMTFFFLMQQISSKILFSPVSPGCTEKQLSVLKSQWGIRMADGHPLSSRVTPPTTSEDLICHKHHRGDVVSRGECLQLTQSKQLGRLPGRMTWKKSELPGGGRLSCR